MYFSKIIEQIGKGNYIFNKEIPLILEIHEGEVKIQFFSENAKVICNENEIEISLNQFSEFTFKQGKIDKDTQEHSYTMFFNKKEILKLPESKMNPIKTLFDNLATEFYDDIECSPKYQVEKSIEKFSIKCKKEYNPFIWKLLLQYQNRIKTAFENQDLKENSEILMVIEEDSGQIIGNLGETAKKSFSNLVKNFNGIGSIVKTGVGIAKSAGTRLAKGMVNNFVSDKNILVLTNFNVILLGKDDIEYYDFDDAKDIFEARQDEVLAGIVDIYDDCEKPILNNVSQIDWNSFKKKLRDLSKNPILISNSSEQIEDEDVFAQAQNKITKLKKMVDAGIITQDDFDSKKAEILSMI